MHVLCSHDEKTGALWHYHINFVTRCSSRFVSFTTCRLALFMNHFSRELYCCCSKRKCSLVLEGNPKFRVENVFTYQLASAGMSIMKLFAIFHAYNYNYPCVYSIVSPVFRSSDFYFAFLESRLVYYRWMVSSCVLFAPWDTDIDWPRPKNLGNDYQWNQF